MSFPFSDKRPSQKQIEDANRLQLKQQKDFRRAAEYAAKAMSAFEEIQRVALIGSVALPLEMEVPRFSEFRRYGIKICHECKDVDLAVWIGDLARLDEMRKAVNRSVNELLKTEKIGVAHHQLDIFFLDPETNRHLGNLCHYGVCPRGKDDCVSSGCGRIPFLKVYEDFILRDSAIRRERSVVLFER